MIEKEATVYFNRYAVNSGTPCEFHPSSIVPEWLSWLHFCKVAGLNLAENMHRVSDTNVLGFET